MKTNKFLLVGIKILHYSSSNYVYRKIVRSGNVSFCLFFVSLKQIFFLYEHLWSFTEILLGRIYNPRATHKVCLMTERGKFVCRLYGDGPTTQIRGPLL